MKPPPVTDRDHVLGADDPKLTLVEYGDFGCPHCFAANRPVMSLIERYDGLRFAWRHLPDSELHPGAHLAAELSELAAADGKFWEAHAALLRGREQVSPEELLSIAETLGLSREDAEVALRDRTFRPRVDEDVDGGRRAGARGTPTFFLDGERLEGHWRQLHDLVPARLG